MTISLDKSIYSKDAIYKSIKVWNEYLYTPSISESKKTVDITLAKDDIEQKIINEFLNYVLDMTSSVELA